MFAYDLQCLNDLFGVNILSMWCFHSIIYGTTRHGLSGSNDLTGQM